MESRKPRAWNLLDFLTFGALGVLTSVAALCVSILGVDEGPAAQGIALLWTTSAVFWGLYFGLVYYRHRAYAPFTLETRHGLLVNPNGYDISVDELEAETERFISLYFGYVPRVRALLQDKVHWVVFRPRLIPHPNPGLAKKGVKVWGFLHAAGNYIEVSFADRAGEPEYAKPLRETALAHELGHSVLGKHLEGWDQKEHHEFMHRHGLP
jgi:hypothetical protein